MTAKYTVHGEEEFWRAFDNLTEVEQGLVMNKINLLEKEGPFYRSLRSKKVRGKPGVFEFSVNMDIRVIWRYENGNIILMLDVGHHDILRNF